MLNSLLNSITYDTSDTPNDEVDETANNQCKNELYLLLLGTDFKMRMQHTKKRYRLVLCLGGNYQVIDSWL